MTQLLSNLYKYIFYRCEKIVVLYECANANFWFLFPIWTYI